MSENIIPKIIPPLSSNMVDALAAAGELVLPYLKRPRQQSIKDDDYCVQVLERIATPNAYRYLKDYLKCAQSHNIDKVQLDEYKIYERIIIRKHRKIKTYNMYTKYCVI